MTMEEKIKALEVMINDYNRLNKEVAIQKAKAEMAAVEIANELYRGKTMRFTINNSVAVVKVSNIESVSMDRFNRGGGYVLGIRGDVYTLEGVSEGLLDGGSWLKLSGDYGKHVLYNIPVDTGFKPLSHLNAEYLTDEEIKNVEDNDKRFGAMLCDPAGFVISLGRSVAFFDEHNGEMRCGDVMGLDRETGWFEVEYWDHCLENRVTVQKPAAKLLVI